MVAIRINKASKLIEQLLELYIASFANTFLQNVLSKEIIDETDFYLKLIKLTKEYPTQAHIEFEKAWSQALNRLELEFLQNFATEEGAIDWEKIVRFSTKNP